MLQGNKTIKMNDKRAIRVDTLQRSKPHFLSQDLSVFMHVLSVLGDWHIDI